jgi:DNA-binding transcriptional LysR family regulator
MAGLGVSLISLHTLALELRTGEIALLDVNGTPIERTWQLVHSRSKQLSPTCLVFRRFLLEHAAPFLEREYAQFALRPPKGSERIGDGTAADAGPSR